MHGSYLIETTATTYNSDVTDAEWALIRPFMPRNVPNGRDVTTSMRDVVNAIFYQDRTGCQWRYLPKDYPPWSTVAGYYYRWMRNGMWERILDTLRGLARQQEGRDAEPTAAIVDSQSVKVPPQAGERGYNGHKKINGRKRHLLVDTMGFMLTIVVTGAQVDDRVGAMALAYEGKSKFPTITHVWADSGYVGAKWHEWFRWFCNWIIEIVKRCDAATGFKIVPRRWVVERTFAWLDRYRRLSKDYEVLPSSSETRCRLASVRLLLKRVTGKDNDFQVACGT